MDYRVIHNLIDELKNLKVKENLIKFKKSCLKILKQKWKTLKKYSNIKKWD